MDLNLFYKAPKQRTDYLTIGIIISIALHAFVLLFKVQMPQTPLVSNKMIEIALINTETELAPFNPQIMAQANLLGGGNDLDGISTSPLPRTSHNAYEEFVLAQLQERQRQLEKQQQQLLIQIEAELSSIQAKEKPDELSDSQTLGQDNYDQETIILNAQIAAIKERIERYNAMPKQHYTGPSAKSDKYAQYLEAWRTHIEQLGTQHYPQEARGKIYGSLQITAYINKDGSLNRIEIDQPSEHAILNLAAQRILQLAAPFAPLPPEIAEETDILVITRTWNFQNQRLKTQIP